MKSSILILLIAIRTPAAFVAGTDNSASLWVSNVVAAGSSVSGQTAASVSRAASALKSSGVWGSIYAIKIQA